MATVAGPDLLRVEGLRVEFPTREGTVHAVAGVDLRVLPGQTLGVVGESGSGKSVTAYAILQAVTRPGRITGGRVLYRRGDEVIDLASLDPQGEAIRAIRGREIAMVFQEPMTAMSMMHTVGFQIVEAIQLHRDVSPAAARTLAIDMLGRVGIPRPADRIDAYPFSLSGGMRQRVMIAMALVSGPRLLIADEPTTALDVTTQAQIMELLRDLQRDLGMAVMLITHDLGVIAEMCDDVAVMYLGEVMEQGDVKAVFASPLHPYTRALLQSIPRLGYGRSATLEPIEGAVPSPYDRPFGCPFHPRCPVALPGVCDRHAPPPVTVADGRTVRCHLYPVSTGEPSLSVPGTDHA